MQQTTNYNLNKPELSDFAKIQALNENADIIDARLKSLQDTKASNANLSSLQDAVGAHFNAINAHAETTDRVINVGANRELKSVQEALETVKKDLGGNDITIDIDPGDYTGFGEITVDVHRYGTLIIKSTSNNAADVLISKIKVDDVNCGLVIRHVSINTNDICIAAYRTNSVLVDECRLFGDASNAAVYLDASNATVQNCLINGKGYAILAYINAKVHSVNNTGENNNVVLQAHGGFITCDGTLPNGTTAKAEIVGGLIRP